MLKLVWKELPLHTYYPDPSKRAKVPWYAAAAVICKRVSTLRVPYPSSGRCCRSTFLSWRCPTDSRAWMWALATPAPVHPTTGFHTKVEKMWFMWGCLLTFGVLCARGLALSDGIDPWWLMGPSAMGNWPFRRQKGTKEDGCSQNKYWGSSFNCATNRGIICFANGSVELVLGKFISVVFREL